MDKKNKNSATSEQIKNIATENLWVNLSDDNCSKILKKVDLIMNYKSNSSTLFEVIQTQIMQLLNNDTPLKELESWYYWALEIYKKINDNLKEYKGPCNRGSYPEKPLI